MPAFFGEAAIGTVLFVRRAFGPSAYILLARLPSRRPMIAGLVLATTALRLIGVVLVVVLGLVGGRLDPNQPAFTAWASLGLLLGGCAVAAVAIVLSFPIGSRRVLAVCVVWVGVATIPARDLAGLPSTLRALDSLLYLPLAPFFNVIPSTLNSRPDYLSLVVLAAYVAALAMAGTRLLRRRSLYLN